MRNGFDRRTFVGAAGAMAMVGADGLGKVFADTAQRNLHVKVTLSSGVHVFESATGKDIGNYIGPNFVQRNVLVRDRAIPFTVFFRPDVTSDRVEVVFEWGDPFNPQPSTLEPYTVEISSDGNTIAKIDVPQHYWLSRWRWQSEPRPFLKTPDDLFAAKIFPRIKRVSPQQALPRPAPDYSIMGFSSITTYMGTTGERGDIGVLPEHYAAYLATGDDSMKKSMMAWAESAGSFPWHIRDPKTWAPLNWNTYPKAFTYSDQSLSSPRLTLSVPGPLKIDRGQQVAIDMAHEPALSFVPFMLTGDLYHLEELQFMAAYLTHFYPVHAGMFDWVQTRGWAWSLRTIIDVMSATPDKIAGGLLPKTYWKQYLDRNLADVLQEHVHAKDVKNAVFSSGTDRRRTAFWQEDYLVNVLGVAVYRGFQVWRPVFEWKIRSNIARANGTSGWPRTSPTSYYCKPGTVTVSGNGKVTISNLDFLAQAGDWKLKFLDGSNFTVTRPNGEIDGQGKVGTPYTDKVLSSLQFVVANDGSYAAGDSVKLSVSMAKSWAELAAMNDIEPTPDGNLNPKTTRDYLQTVRAAFVMGVLNGVPEAAACLEWYEPQMMAVYPPGWRWSFST
jgi:hypothetical protein